MKPTPGCRYCAPDEACSLCVEDLERRRVAPGIYDDDQGGLRVDVEELLAEHGYDATPENRERLAGDIATIAAAYDVPINEADDMPYTDEQIDRAAEAAMNFDPSKARVIDPLEELARLRRVNEIYRKALARISDNPSGHWGQVAHRALRAASEL